MISSKNLIKMARKWRNLTIVSRKRITFSTSVDAEDCSATSIIKGHVVVYSADKARFSIPMAYLDNNLFRELLRMAEDEYGLPSDGPIVLPCDATSMEYAISLIRGHATIDLELAFFMTVRNDGACTSSSCFHQPQSNMQTLICSY